MQRSFRVFKRCWVDAIQLNIKEVVRHLTHSHTWQLLCNFVALSYKICIIQIFCVSVSFHFYRAACNADAV